MQFSADYLPVDFQCHRQTVCDPHGLMATIAAMIAVTAMGRQFALLRLTLPVAPSTAGMTGNLTNAVRALVDSKFNEPSH